MKHMHCRDLGGECDEQLSAETSSEMVKKMIAHVTANHPNTEKKMEETHAADPDKWGTEFKKQWADTPDS